jgi:hypothetical protein
MPINVYDDVQAEAESKKQTVLNYDAATLDSDLLKLEELADFVDDTAKLINAANALDGNVGSNPRLAQLASSLRAVPSSVRSLIAEMKIVLDPPTGDPL